MPAYPIPFKSQGNWTVGTHVGVDGGIDQYRAGGASARTVTTFVADNTGATSVSAALQTAINSATAGTAIYVPPGTYLLTSPVSLGTGKRDITLRGAGASTTFLMRGTGSLSIYGFATAYNFNAQTISGVRTKGTSVLSVPDSTAYSVGELATVIANNETDNVRIQAGAAPTWSQYAYQGFRRCTVRVVAKGTGSITVDPPLPWDLTDVGGRIERGGPFLIERCGFEDFNIQFDTASFPLFGITIGFASNCWVYNVNLPTWTRSTASGSMIFISGSYKVEVRHCDGFSEVFTTPGGSTITSSDGFIQPQYCSSCLFEDCIFHNWDVGFYSSGRMVNCAVLHCFVLNDQSGSQTGFNLSHGGGDTLTLVEGNHVCNAGLDGYHASAGQMVIHRNWLHGTNFARTLRGFQIAHRRFTRDVVHVGNIFGIDGWSNPSISLGNPNIGNANNNGGTTNTTTGDFWDDWELTGTLTTRLSDTSGVVTVSGGEWASTSGGSTRVVALLWNGRTSHRVAMTIVSRVGLVLTLSGGSGPVLPVEGTVFDLVQPNTSGFQELDLAVAATLTSVHNYECSQTGAGSLVNPLTGTDILADSYAYSARPGWWPTSLAWPPVNPESPVFNFQLLPAGYRFFNGVDAPSGSPAIPIITENPLTQTVEAGSDVILSANATGNPTPEWGWTKNGTPISGATTRFLSLLDVTDAAEGSYVATATNSQGSAVSAAAVLTVVDASDTTAPTPNPSTISGVPEVTSTSVSVTSTTAIDASSPPVEYNHSINGVFAGWQSSPTRVFAGLTPATTYSFRVKSRDAAGNETTQSDAMVRTTDAATSAASPLGNRGSRTFTVGII